MERILSKKLKDGKFQNVPLIRSKTMSAIKAKGNKTTEVKFRFVLVRNGIKGWKLHPKGIIGNPDFFFPKHKIAIFIDGCFWHGCPKCGHVPKTNTPYWKTKIQRNRRRDKEKGDNLRELGIRVLRLWEHDLKENDQRIIRKIAPLIND